MKHSQFRHLVIGIVLFFILAGADILLTLVGTGGDLSLEGNPLMRIMMSLFGPFYGLLIEKSVVLSLALLITVIASIGIEQEASWVYFLALTPMTKRWMKQKKRHWVAFLPLYAVTAFQGLAALSWIYILFIIS